LAAYVFYSVALLIVAATVVLLIRILAGQISPAAVGIPIAALLAVLGSMVAAFVVYDVHFVTATVENRQNAPQILQTTGSFKCFNIGPSRLEIFRPAGETLPGLTLDPISSERFEVPAAGETKADVIVSELFKVAFTTVLCGPA